ncbi:MAG: hypothetical protein H6550_14640 [Chitinophagales bacterium]|nr:hypothetical protein [Chitinophagales bacterium]
MKINLVTIWITVNILLAALMVYFVVTAGIGDSKTLFLIFLTNLSALLFIALRKKMVK